MNVLIQDVTKDNVHCINQFLLELVLDEKKYDSNINDQFKLDNFYNEIINNKNIKLLIAFDDDIALGYLYGYIEEHNLAYIKRKAKIEALYISTEYRNRQIASRLISTFETWVKDKGIDYIEVSVCKSNINATNLYKKKKFKTYKHIMYKEY